MELLAGAQAALAEYVATAAADAAAHDAIVRLISDVARPADRTTYDPGHLTASGVVRDRHTSRILLIHHAKLNRWLQPGGHIEPSDRSLLEAARREIAEETGLADVIVRGLIDLDVHEFPARGSEPAHLHHDVRFLFDLASDEPVAGEGALSAQWFGLDDIGTVTTDDSVVRLARKALT